MAQQFFPNTSPLGSHFGTSGPESSSETEIVGVVKDVRSVSVTEQFQPMVYFPLAQHPQPLDHFAIRFSGVAETVVPQVREAIKQVNRNIAIDEVVSLSDHIGRSLVQQKLVARLASFFGLLALMLACIGLYGVLSYAVARRTNEIGIRMALGAEQSTVLWLVLREAMALVMAGVVIGLTSAIYTTRIAEGLLFQLRPTDPLTLAAASLLLIVIGTLAGYLPARRATKVDPMTALRYE